MYPKMLPKGTIILLGKQDGYDHRSFGMRIEIPKDTPEDRDGWYESVMCKVLTNPNGWPFEDVLCGVNLRADKIVGGPLATNKHNKDLLERYDN